MKTNQWFGPRIEGRLCESVLELEQVEQVATPVGESCVFCRKPIEASDSGLIFGETGLTPVHFDCLLDMDAMRTAVEGLDILRYHGKWKVAKQMALTNARTDDNRLLPYWERVRLLFLELGGEYL